MSFSITILALRGWRSGLVGRADRGRELLRDLLRLSRAPLAGSLLRERERESSRGVTERARDPASSSIGVGERPRETLRLSDMLVKI